MPQPFCLAISATFTAEPIEPVLAFWGRQFNLPVEVRFAPYNQVTQSLLDPQSVLARNGHGLNVLLVRSEDLGATAEQAERNVLELAQTAAAARLQLPLLFVLCPPASLELKDSLAGSLRAVRFLHFDQIAAEYPVANWDSPDGHRLGRIPYTELYFAALGTAVFRHAHSLFATPSKVIVLDCDNTLWSGICGEDGPTGIILDAPRRELQQFMRVQRDAGMLLAIASKNNEADVRETFAQNPDMPLRFEDFVASRIDWQPKSANLPSLAEELNLGLDSFLFVDDNPRECAEVADSLPEVFTIPLPVDPEHIPNFLRQLWVFDHPVITEEDRRRSSMYAQNRAYSQALQSTASLENFLESLHLVLDVQPLREETLPRAAQLTQRTNQFNFTTIRRTESELRSLIDSGALEGRTISVTDRFGKYGVTGLMLYKADGDCLVVDTFLLSCRVLGRGVEHHLFRWLGAQAEEKGLAKVEVQFAPTAKNTPAREFLNAISADASYRFDAAALRAVRPRFAPAPQPALKPSTPVQRERADYLRIATELATPEQILAAMRSRHRSSASVFGSETERRLAAIWSDLLQRQTVSPGDNFFDLGGHSLLAVLLLVRIKETFDIELSIDDVYSSGMTLRKLAELIAVKQATGLDAAEYAALVAEIDTLSDDEVRELLAREEGCGE